MSGPRSARVVDLSDLDRAALTTLTRRTTGAAGLVRRARMVLLAADGMPLDRIARTAWGGPDDRADLGGPLSSGRAGRVCRIVRGRVGRGPFPPEVRLHLVRRACELPEQAGRSLSQWDCAELARTAS